MSNDIITAYTFIPTLHNMNALRNLFGKTFIGLSRFAVFEKMQEVTLYRKDTRPATTKRSSSLPPNCAREMRKYQSLSGPRVTFRGIDQHNI